jgi:hypothetical protein
MTTNKSAARPVLLGSTRLSMAAVATAASIALPPLRMICRPASAASGWLVATMPCGAITSERLCAVQPLARSPRTAAQAGAFDSATQVESCGNDCAKDGDAGAIMAIAATTPRARNFKASIMSSHSGAAEFLLIDTRAG